ncbi:MAG: hypothetical protein V9G19_02860 [Tetrasphaera sp.]
MDIADHHADWRGLLRLAAWAAFCSVGLLVVQVVVMAVWPPVHTVPDVLALMQRSPVLGLVSLDVLLLVNNILVLLVYLGLAVVLWPTFRSGVVVAVVLGIVQIAAYCASNPGVELLMMARADARTTDPSLQSAYRAAGEALLSSWKGTAFLVYYFLGAVVLLLLAALIRRSPVFSSATFWWALAAGVLMVVPSTSAWWGWASPSRPSCRGVCCACCSAPG